MTASRSVTQPPVSTSITSSRPASSVAPRTPTTDRAKQIQLSDKGKALVESGFSARYLWADKLAQSLDPKDQEKVAEALTILTEAARKLDACEVGLHKYHHSLHIQFTSIAYSLVRH